MTNEVISIKAQKRVPGLAKSGVKALRKQGLVPGVLYGKKVEPTQIQVDVKALPKGHTKAQVVSLDLEGSTKSVLMREVQYDTLKDRLVHIDFQEVTPEETVFVDVPLAYSELSKEQQKEGRFRIHRRSLRVKCQVKAIPHHFDVDVSKLKVEDSAYLGDLPLPEGVTVNSQANLALATLAKS